MSAIPPASAPAFPVPSSPAESPPLVVIEPRSGWRAIDLAELWRYRDLLYFLAWRDVKVRYKQTVLGAAWAVIQPVMTMAVFSVFFGRLGGLDRHTGDVPYPVFVYAGILPWTFFAAAVTQSSQSLISSSNLITKVYFPRLIVPLSSIGAGLVDFAISFGVMLVLMAAWGVAPSPQLALAPLLVAGTLLAALGAGTLLAALTVEYRDFRYVVPFLVQIWMFVSPVAYPLEVVPEEWQLAYAINPLAGLISGYRAAFLGGALRWDLLAVSMSVAALSFVAGALYFRRVERRFADVV